MAEIPFMANRLLRKIPQNSSPAMFSIRMVYFRRLKGWLILMSIMKPTSANNMVAAVAISSFGRENTLPQTTRELTASTSVRPAGRAFSRTFRINRPSIRFLLGSSASRKPGAPMVNNHESARNSQSGIGILFYRYGAERSGI